MMVAGGPWSHHGLITPQDYIRAAPYELSRTLLLRQLEGGSDGSGGGDGGQPVALRARVSAAHTCRGCGAGVVGRLPATV